MWRWYKRLRNRYFTVFLILRLILPVFITVILILLLISLGIAIDIIHPSKTLEVIDPSAYHLYASEFTWDGANDAVLQGWYIRGSNQAPLIVLLHGYDTNRTEVLSLASRLQDYGYNILLYNQRGHGNSAQGSCSLGILEAEDLKQAIEKLVTRPEIDFKRIGIFGSSLGGYAALKASKGNPHITALVLDSVYPSINSFIELEVQRVVGFKTSVLSTLSQWMFQLYFRVPGSQIHDEFKTNDFTDKTILFITGKDRNSSDLAKGTRRLYTLLDCRKEILNLANSRESLLFGEEKHRYDQFVLDFLKNELPLIEDTVKIDLEPTAQ